MLIFQSELLDHNNDYFDILSTCIRLIEDNAWLSSNDDSGVKDGVRADVYLLERHGQLYRLLKV